MKDVTADKLQIAYVGHAVEAGQMSMLALGSSLRGQALFVERISEILYGDTVKICVDVDYQCERGSLIVPVHIISDAVAAGEHFLTSQSVTAFVVLLTLAGFAKNGAVSLYKLFKKLKGRRIEKPEEIPAELLDEALITLVLLIRIYNDPEIQKHLRRTLDALHHEGIEEF